MRQEQHSHPSQVFILRVWQEELGQGVTEWRGQVRHVMSGQTLYFREWSVLTRLLLALLAEQQSSPDQD